MQRVKKWQWGISVSYDKKGGKNLKVEHSSQRFFCAERVVVRGYRSDCVGSGIEGQQRVGFDRRLQLTGAIAEKTQHQAALFPQKTEVLKVVKILPLIALTYLEQKHSGCRAL